MVWEHDVQEQEGHGGGHGGGNDNACFGTLNHNDTHDV